LSAACSGEFNPKRLKACEPNKAHYALAELEHCFEGQFLLITQNVDDLHRRAGSPNLIDMHGELLKTRCMQSGQIFTTTEDIDFNQPCSCCKQKRTLRPHIIWFGEMPFAIDKIAVALASCDLFVAIGTSGNVYPAAGFVQQALRSNAATLELNLEPSERQARFKYKNYGLATKLVPIFVKNLLAGRELCVAN
jgi:NAD-dependent deacetylase